MSGAAGRLRAWLAEALQPPRRSIASRFLWLHLAAVAATCAAMTVASWLLLHATLAAFERRSLDEHAQAIVQALQRGPRGPVLDLPEALRLFYAHGYDGFAYAIVDEDGQALYSSRAPGEVLFARDRRLARAAFFQNTHGPDAFYGASFPTDRGGRPLWIQIEQNLDHPDVFVDDVVAAFLGRIIWLIGPLLLLLLGADVLIVRRALAPVREASDQAEAIDPTRLEVRLPIAGLPAEVAPLVKAVNAALDRLERGFRIQRDFTADAAHELRTPLAVLRLRLDGLADRAAAEALRADLDAMAHIVEQLLASAEMESFALKPEERADLAAVAVEVASFIAPLAVTQGKRVEVTGADRPVVVHGNAEALFRALRNLVDNAVAHSPEGGAVEIAVSPDGSVAVDDSGPGVRPADRELIFQRFWRQRREATRGGGLGLGIVARIAQAHAGEVEVGDSPNGGARFTLRLRPAGSGSAP
jgi:signal transduction histidine kinase